MIFKISDFKSFKGLKQINITIYAASIPAFITVWKKITLFNATVNKHIKNILKKLKIIKFFERKFVSLNAEYII